MRHRDCLDGRLQLGACTSCEFATGCWHRNNPSRSAALTECHTTGVQPQRTAITHGAENLTECANHEVQRLGERNPPRVQPLTECDTTAGQAVRSLQPTECVTYGVCNLRRATPRQCKPYAVQAQRSTTPPQGGAGDNAELLVMPA